MSVTGGSRASWPTRCLVAAAFALSIAGCGSRAPLEVGTPAASDAGTHTGADKVDVLVVVDNTASMEPKQRLLSNALADLVTRLANPVCVDGSGHGSAPPSDPSVSCPPGQHKEFAPVTDLHLGIITTSLGSHGGDACAPIQPGYDPMMDDHAHLVGSLDRGAGIPTWNDTGFLAWDPAGREGLGSEQDLSAFIAHSRALMRVVGTHGCGYESPFEAFYRFLADPQPYASIPLAPCSGQSGAQCATPSGLDQALLYQRSAFLRPDSLLLVIVMSDENDCSFKEGGLNYIAATTGVSVGSTTLPRGTSACDADPSDRCCVSCSSQAPAGCPSTQSDASCKKGAHTDAEDPANLRCWDDKRRFGYDFLYPIDRYRAALSSPQLPDRSGAMVQNPVFAGGMRNPSRVFVATLAGVPWQLIARQDTPGGRLEYADIGELDARWQGILSDPHMIESPTPRPGLPGPTASGLPDAISGHEFDDPLELEYACIFPLWNPVSCAPGELDCDCHDGDLGADRPVCQPPGGGPPTTTEYATQAYPGLRQLDLVHSMGKQGIAASICARNTADQTQPDFGYRPLVGAIVEHIAKEL